MQVANKMQQFPFIDLFKSALHVSADVFAHPQEQFNCIYSFGTMHRSAADQGHGSAAGHLHRYINDARSHKHQVRCSDSGRDRLQKM
jgi:hypothetical protein